MKTIYNRGRREWDIAIKRDSAGKVIESAKCLVGGSAELPDKIADNYIAMYPKEFMATQPAPGGSRQVKTLRKQVESQEAEISGLKTEKDELLARIAELEKKAKKNG